MGGVRLVGALSAFGLHPNKWDAKKATGSIHVRLLFQPENILRGILASSDFKAGSSESSNMAASHGNVAGAAEAILMIIIGALRPPRHFHILSHGSELKEHNISIFLLAPLPVAHEKPKRTGGIPTCRPRE